MPAAPWLRPRHVAALTLAAGIACVQGCSETPVGPTRYGPPVALIRCETWIANDLACRAVVSCSLYPCMPGTPDDVTATARWMVDDEGVAKVTGPGRIAAVAPGHTVVRIEWMGPAAFRPLSVFPESAPMPTSEIFGSIYEGATPAAGRIDGAVVDVLTGVIAGRRAVSGAPPDPHPGFFQVASPGYYRIVGVPPGTFRIRVTKEGFVPQEREVAAGPADFQLQRQ